MRVRAYYKWPRNCFKCGRRIKVMVDNSTNPECLTVDHIIPKSVLYELEMIELLFDLDNFQVWCYGCNENKGNQIPDELPPRLLEKFNALITERNYKMRYM